MTQAETAARKFWEVFPAVVRTTFAEARSGSHKLSPGHMRILRILSERECSVTELADWQDVSLPSMSATIQALVERGWLERENSQEDRRVFNLRLTKMGKQVLVDEYKRLIGRMAKRLEKLDPKEVEQIQHGLELLLSLFDEAREHRVDPERQTV